MRSSWKGAQLESQQQNARVSGLNPRPYALTRKQHSSLSPKPTVNRQMAALGPPQQTLCSLSAKAACRG